MKRKAKLFGSLTAAALLLAACSGNSGNNGSGTSDPDGDSSSAQDITFLTHWGPDEVALLEEAGDAFTEANPEISVTVQAVPFANLLSTLRTQGASPSGPTIAGIYDAWLPELVRDGLAAEAPEGVTSEVSENWPSSLFDAASIDGTLYGIPNEVDLYELNYNQALFDDAGITEAPTTWSDLKDAAKKISETADDVQGFGVITNWNSGAVHPFLSLLASNGGTFLNEAGTESNLSSPEAQETFELITELIEAGAIDPSMSPANANTTGPYLDNFVNGKTGMIIMANWWEGALRDGMGDDFSNVKTAPIPVGPSGSTSSPISYSWLTMVNAQADSGKQEAAWKFLQYLNGPDSGESGSSAMADLLMSMGILPSRESDVEAHSEALSEPFIKTYVDALDSATPFPTVLGGAPATDALQSQLEALITGGMDAQTVMQQAKQEVDAALQSAQ